MYHKNSSEVSEEEAMLRPERLTGSGIRKWQQEQDLGDCRDKPGHDDCFDCGKDA